MDIAELPESIRVKIEENGERKLWEKIENQGVKSFCRKQGYSSSRVYNWKNKSDFLPVELVREILGNRTEVKAIKGRGRSGTVEEPELDFPELDELLTRIDTSVKVNRNGSPMYQTDDTGNAKRFNELLNKVGDGPYRTYSHRSYYQINYPKFLHKILVKKDFDRHKGAVVDEKASVENGHFITDHWKLKISDFKGKLYSREKSARLALEKGDENSIQKIISEEAQRAKKLFEN